jgi:hypothetical protein
VTELLARGFPGRPRKYWTTALTKLASHGAPEGCPEFGYLLEADGAVVGALLLIFSERDGQLRCNVSSWYVEPEHRGHAAVLASMSSKLKHVTYLNVSPAEHTRPILKALGYRLYNEGQFVALPALSRGGHGKVRKLADAPEHRAMPDYELLRAHADAGCTVAVCETDAGLEPFVFLRRRMAYAPLGVAQLVYARDTRDFAHRANALGRFLLAQGVLAVICDAADPIPGLAGLHFAHRGARYFKGAAAPALNDLAFTEMVLFGA